MAGFAALAALCGWLAWRVDSAWAGVRVLGGICLAGHLGHLAIVCVADQPLTRYVWATEPLVWVGVAALARGPKARTPAAV